MIGKIKKGAGFVKCVKYVLEKDGASLLLSQAVRIENALLAAQDFKRCADQNEKLQKPVIHMAISFHPSDVLTENQMSDIAKQVIVEMGFENAPYIVVKHTDNKNPHMHIVTSRVDFAGKTVSDQMDFVRLNRISRKVEMAYPFLKKAKGKDLTQIKRERLRGKDKKIIELYTLINTETHKAKSLDALLKTLRSKGVYAELKYKRGSITEVQGIKFFYKGIWISGSKIDRSCSYKSLLKAIQGNKAILNQINRTEGKTENHKKKGVNIGKVINNTIMDDLFDTNKGKSKSFDI